MPRALVVLAFSGCLLLGAAWSLLTPLTAVPDEATHVIRAVSVWHGDLVGRRFVFSDPGPPPVEATMFEVSIPEGYGDMPLMTACYTGPEGGSANCAPPLGDGPDTVLTATIAGVYQPLPYLVYGAGSPLLSPTKTIYLGRVLSAVVTAALAAAGFACAWLVGGRRLLAALLLALTPVAAWLFGAINPSGIEIAAGLALWTAVPALLRHPEQRWVAVVLVAAVTGVAWSRPLAPAMAVGIIAAAVVLVADRASLVGLRGSRPARVALGAAAVSIAGAIAWVAATGALSTFIARPDPALTPGVAAAGSWAAGPSRLRQMVGFFGLLETPAPPALWWAWGTAVVVLLALGLRCGTWRHRGVILALVVATVALPVLAEATTAAELGYTWQGRYTMPVAMGALVASGWALVHGGRPLRQHATTILLFGISGVVAFGHVLAPLAATARFAQGRGSALFGWFDAAPWSPPGPDLLLLAAAGVGALTLCAALLVADGTVSDPPAVPQAG